MIKKEKKNATGKGKRHFNPRILFQTNRKCQDRTGKKEENWEKSNWARVLECVFLQKKRSTKKRKDTEKKEKQGRGKVGGG